MNAIVERDQEGNTMLRPRAVEEVAPRGEADSLMAVISRMATDPAANIEKLERLVSLYERTATRNAEQAFNEAMSEAQADMRSITADSSNSQTKSKYASYHALDKALRPIYTKNGFALSFDTAEGAPEQCVRIVCFVSRGGYTRQYHVDMPADGKGAKGGDVMTRTHAVGAAMTYGQRYLLKMIFNIAVGEDDDGNESASYERISDDQVIELRELLESKGAPQDKFLKWAKVERLADLRADFFASAKTAIGNYASAK